jgi:hypothetical protein
MQIEFKPFIVMNGGKEIELDQKYVIVDGKVVGYLPDQPDSRLLPIVNLPNEQWAEIIAECERFRGGEVPPPFPIGFVDVNEETGEYDDGTEE